MDCVTPSTAKSNNYESLVQANYYNTCMFKSINVLAQRIGSRSIASHAGWQYYEAVNSDTNFPTCQLATRQLV